MNWITSKNPGFKVQSIRSGVCDSEYFNKDLNLDLCYKITTGCIDNELFDIFTIRFHYVSKNTVINWYFKEDSERDSVYEKIKSLLDLKEI